MQEPEAPKPTISNATSLEELMLKRGLISQDGYIRLKAEYGRRISETAMMAEAMSSPRWYERLRH
ncbi:hypothetical protein W02_00200 [Nitrospira sp. KM1]|nr:hypothetical protein W02_00200 [Nitrospira sp. KM1]